jgi:hypothetical protein
MAISARMLGALLRGDLPCHAWHPREREGLVAPRNSLGKEFASACRGLLTRDAAAPDLAAMGQHEAASMAVACAPCPFVRRLTSRF